MSPEEKVHGNGADEFGILIVESLNLVWFKGAAISDDEASIDDCLQMGVPDDARFSCGSSAAMIFRTDEDSGRGWSSYEFLLAGRGEWALPSPHHSDFVSVREPGEGEIFESASNLFWITPTRLEKIDGEFATGMFKERHGAIVGDLDAAMRLHAFERCLDLLVGEYEHALEGESGDRLVAVLNEEVEKTFFLRAAESKVNEIAANVNGLLSGIARAG